MNKKIKNTLGILACLVIIAGLAWFIGDTYAKYRDQISGSTNANLARWNIKVNSEEIKNKTELTSPIIAYFPETQYTAAGVVAPGSYGYFDVVIDSSQVDVAFDYTITCTAAQNSAISDMRLIGYKLSPSGIDDMANPQTLTNGTVTGTVTVSATSTVVRVFVQWYDGTGEGMNNELDTSTVLNNTSTVIMNTSISFSQHR